jgi:hypothetical protein
MLGASAMTHTSTLVWLQVLVIGEVIRTRFHWHAARSTLQITPRPVMHYHIKTPSVLRCNQHRALHANAEKGIYLAGHLHLLARGEVDHKILNPTIQQWLASFLYQLSFTLLEYIFALATNGW